MYKFIEYSVRNRVAYITLNKVNTGNALDKLLIQELADAMDTALKDYSTKVIVIKANGPTFCTGIDTAYHKKMQEQPYTENLHASNQIKELLKSIYHHPKVVIAQVQGDAVALGFALAYSCDFVFASTNVRMGHPEVSLGLIPAIALPILLRKTNEATARMLLLSGKLISATEALDYGLISHTCTAEQLDIKVEQFASALCLDNSTQSMAVTKKLIAQLQGMPLEDALTYAAESSAQNRLNEDSRKGIASLILQEKPRW
ncbi:enoyl-CoA hydratase-related protein [Limibacter armeniacum]|uniref:enoyl-CoA hydratase/isomerase family protein n=1 Tax=Limibacter armeniacum TaxID=466084 RepID=UPI002FE645B4